MADEITALHEQMGGFESSVTEQLDRVENKIAAIAQAVGVPAPEVKAEPWQPMPVFEEVVSAPLPPAAPAGAPGGTAPGFVSTVAHKVAEIAEGAVDAVRSLAEPTDGYSDAEIAAATAHVAAAMPHAGVAPHAGAAPDVRVASDARVAPLGPHTQAVVEERRMQPAPSVVAA